MVNPILYFHDGKHKVIVLPSLLPVATTTRQDRWPRYAASASNARPSTEYIFRSEQEIHAK